jgi:hypothetical protein
LVNLIVPGAGDGGPGGLLALVAAGLAARGVPGGYCHQEDGGCLLRVTGLAGRHCTVIADDSGYVLADCWPAGPRCPDPAVLAATVMRVLGDREDWQPGPPVTDPDLALLGRVGLALRAGGLAVRLDVQADERNLEVCAQVVVTSAGQPGRGQVRIGDDGALSWECDTPHPGQQQQQAERIAGIVAAIAAGT